jgi:uncharacterized protein DUF929
MAKSKRPPQQPKRIGQSQPEGVTRAAGRPGAAAGAGKTSATGANGATNGKATSGTASGATSASRLSGIRERSQGAGAQRKPQQRTRYAQPPWWRRNLGLIITVSVVVVLIGAFVAFAKFQNNKAAAGIGDPVPSAVMTNLTSVPASTFDKVGAGSALEQLQATAPNTPLLSSGGTPKIVYVGAEYCPYCAAERWGTVVALSRFGTFKGLILMRSSSSDVFPNTPTLSFRDAKYTSKYIVFDATETQDRTNQPLASPAADVMDIFKTYDAPPYIDAQNQGSIPFMSYGNQYVSIGGPFSQSTMTTLQGLDWQQVSSQLKDPNSDVAKAIIGSANYQTAAICKLTNNQPGNVCNTPVIQQLEGKLPVAK